MVILETQGLNKTFGKKDAAVQALNDVSIKISEGESVAIMGKSGSGKSTLLNVLGGLMGTDSGTVYYKGNSLDYNNRKEMMEYRRHAAGFIVQYFALIEDMTIYDNVAVALRYHKLSRQEMRKRIMDTLDMLEIADKYKGYPPELSGGQQQRAAIARAIVKEPQIILADEPTGALDRKTGDSVLDLFRMIHKTGKTLIMVTHDAGITKVCDRIIQIEDGKII